MRKSEGGQGTVMSHVFVYVIFIMAIIIKL